MGGPPALLVLSRLLTPEKYGPTNHSTMSVVFASTRTNSESCKRRLATNPWVGTVTFRMARIISGLSGRKRISGQLRNAAMPSYWNYVPNQFNPNQQSRDHHSPSGGRRISSCPTTPCALLWGFLPLERLTQNLLYTRKRRCLFFGRIPGSAQPSVMFLNRYSSWRNFISTDSGVPRVSSPMSYPNPRISA